MKNLLLSKSLLSKSLSKSLSKVFLIVALFFGGCSTTTTETNTTPTDALIDLIGGGAGIYDGVEAGFTALPEGQYYGFYISDDATYYREYSNGVLYMCLEYTTGTDTSATYEGVYINDYGIARTMKARLTSLTSTGGRWTMYINGNKYTETAFDWDQNWWNKTSTSSVSSELYSSAIQALSQQ